MIIEIGPLIGDSKFGFMIYILMFILFLFAMWHMKKRGGKIEQWQHENTIFGRVVKFMLILFIIISSVVLLSLVYLKFRS